MRRRSSRALLQLPPSWSSAADSSASNSPRFARQLGKSVTVIETQPRLMARVVAPVISDFFAGLHREHGAAIKLGDAVLGIHGEGGRVVSVATGDGSTLPADLVVVGIGVEANDEIAREAGLTCKNGVEVDHLLATSDPSIFAIGDCAQHHNVFMDARVRVESVQNAVDQARSVASAILGTPEPYRAVPWFWSDQYDVKLQMVGFSSGYDEVVLRGQPASRQFSAFYYRGGALIGIDSVNRAGDHMLGRRLMAAGTTVPPAAAADEAVNLKGFLG